MKKLFAIIVLGTSLITTSCSKSAKPYVIKYRDVSTNSIFSLEENEITQKRGDTVHFDSSGDAVIDSILANKMFCDTVVYHLPNKNPFRRIEKSGGLIKGDSVLFIGVGKAVVDTIMFSKN